jgi:membrane-associated phospholipid phosphatase
MSGPSKEEAQGARWERALLTLLLLSFFAGGYFAVAFASDPARARALPLALDGRIPFVPASVCVYVLVYSAALSPLFLVRCRRLFRRTALSFALAIALALPCFLLWPVTSVGLRPPLETLDPSRFVEWGVMLLYTWDPPVNLFPSLHIALAALAGLAAWKAQPAAGAVALPAVGMIGVSVCTVKQHFLVDVLAGAALALAIYSAVLRPYRAGGDAPTAYSWRGPVGFLALQVAVFLGAFVAFRSGFAPWSG